MGGGTSYHGHGNPVNLISYPGTDPVVGSTVFSKNTKIPIYTLEDRQYFSVILGRLNVFTCKSLV
jgi:hypothetical protein